MFRGSRYLARDSERVRLTIGSGNQIMGLMLSGGNLEGMRVIRGEDVWAERRKKNGTYRDNTVRLHY